MSPKHRVFTTRIALALSVAVFALAVVPGAAQGGATKIPVTIELTGMDDDDNLHGRLLSANRKCIASRGEDDLLDLRLETADQFFEPVVSDADGKFMMEERGFSQLDFADLTAYVEKKRFGRKTRRKICLPDTAQMAVDYAEITLDSFAFDDSTDTFYGTLSSPKPACTASVPMTLSHSYMSSENTYDFFSGPNASYSYAWGSQPPHGGYHIVSDGSIEDQTFAGASSFANGDGSAVFCKRPESEEGISVGF